MTNTQHIFMPEDHMETLYNSPNKLVRFVHVNRLESIVKSIPENKRLKILDAGCGEGHLIAKMYENNKENLYFGADITDIAADKAKSRCPYAKITLCNLSKLPFEDNFFDIVVCTEVLEHIYDFKDVAEELKRVLKTNSYLIITFPNETLWTISRFFLGRKPIKVPDHINSFNPKKMKAIIGLNLISEINLPFKLPFCLSLSCLLKFQK
jgi:ubiquinone/menaquinone biosynthesis C-methylase UbiE